MIRTNLAHSEVLPAGFTPTAVDPDPPPRRARQPAIEAQPSWNLDGWYVWLGPSGAAGRVRGAWDSSIGGNLAVVRVRERELLGTLGACLGASRWTERGGGRIWLDAVAGTRIGPMLGVTAGPILELSDVARPRLGASVGIWTFAGVTPYARAGTVTDLGSFVEIGVHIALPVIRRRH